MKQSTTIFGEIKPMAVTYGGNYAVPISADVNVIKPMIVAAG